MARHTIQIPIIKSSNGHQIWYQEDNPSIVPKISEYLYIGAFCRCAVAWNGSLVPKGKTIVKVELAVYTDYELEETIAMRYTDFSEGGDIPATEPTDITSSVGFKSGWTFIDIGTPIGSSLVLGIVRPYYLWFGGTELHSHRNDTNKPYIRVTYDDNPPDKPTSLYPSGITVSTRDVIRFSWLHNSKEGNQQKAFSLQYSTNGGSTWTTVNQTTPNQYYDMPANTLPTTGTVMWRVKTLDSNDSESEYSTASFTLGVVPQKAPIPISPISQYLDENKPIRFEWSFVGGSGSEYQSKFNLQYSINGGSTWTTKTVTTPNTFYELPASTFSGGNILWRVRTYNNWNEVSPYSENKSFTVIGSPPIPLISSVSNSARPIITWQSTGQHIYELQILKDNKVIFETGSIPSTSDRNFKVPIYLVDGNYLVKLRIANEYNLHSTWAEKSFIISTVKPQKPFITVFSGEYSVTIKSDNTSLKTLVYRDNILIGEVINNSFVDFTGENNREYQYFIRTIDSNDNFSDSDIKLAKCKFAGNTLALSIYPDDFIKLKYGLDSIPKKTNSISNSGNLVYYDGREYPVVEYSEFRSKSKTVSFTLKTKEELNKLIELISSRKTLLFRDTDGENIYGSIFDLEYSKTILGYYEVGFTITKTEV